MLLRTSKIIKSSIMSAQSGDDGMAAGSGWYKLRKINRYLTEVDNAIRFLRKLENYLKKLQLGDKGELFTAIECLKGDVRTWSDRYIDKWKDFKDLKKSVQLILGMDWMVKYEAMIDIQNKKWTFILGEKTFSVNFVNHRGKKVRSTNFQINIEAKYCKQDINQFEQSIIENDPLRNDQCDVCRRASTGNSQNEYLEHLEKHLRLVMEAEVMSDAERIQVDPSKIKVIQELPQPRNKKKLQSFLGLCNFYRRYILLLVCSNLSQNIGFRRTEKGNSTP
ncbi:hypothetical protein FQA39_LY09914 [Lamprigera yunnana]|nr:hypothetical protein FQA39_LY09914 [Lamprigera yunnana]